MQKSYQITDKIAKNATAPFAFLDRQKLVLPLNSSCSHLENCSGGKQAQAIIHSQFADSLQWGSSGKDYIKEI